MVRSSLSFVFLPYGLSGCRCVPRRCTGPWRRPGKDGSLEGAGPLRRPVAARQTAEEALHGLLRRDAQHRLHRPGHARSVMYPVPPVRTRSSAVGTWVWVPHRADTPPVQIAAPGPASLTGGLRVEVHQGEVRGSLRQQPVRCREGVVRPPGQTAPADEVDDPDPDGPQIVDAAAPARRPAAVVGGPQQPGGRPPGSPRSGSCEGVVAQRHHIGAGVIDALRLLPRQSTPAAFSPFTTVKSMPLSFCTGRRCRSDSGARAPSPRPPPPECDIPWRASFLPPRSDV